MKQLPVEIFLIIQKYLGNAYQYRLFMNCNKAIFQSIKYQTIYYAISISQDDLDEDNHVKLRKIQTLVSRVKDKSKQIGLILNLFNNLFNNEILMLHEHLFSHLNYLNISFPDQITNDLNFNIFNHIYHVDLYGLKGVAMINSGFEKVKILILCDLPDLITLDLRHVQLYEIKLSGCPKLSIMKGINTASCVSVRNITLSGDGFQLAPNIPYESILIQCAGLSMNMFHHADLSRLYNLQLYDLIVRESDDLSIFKNIKHLTIASIIHHRYRTIPLFYGTSLHLIRFDLQSWTSTECIPNVKRIRLVGCTNLDPQLSFLKNARVISLDGIDQISQIPTFPTCTHLHLSTIKCLQLIAAQPRLLNLKISNCLQLYDCDIDGQILNQVELYKCVQLNSLYNFRNTRELIIFPLTTNLSFSSYNSSDLPSSARIVRIFAYVSTQTNIRDCSNIANLHLLELKIDGGVRKVCQLHDIHTVQIKITSDEFEEISYLRNIQVLQFTRVKHLTSLHHLENIDKIMLCAFPADFQFDGLKGCRVVYSRGNKRLEEQAELYGRGERDVSLFDSNYLEMFGSIEEFYVVQGDDRVILPDHADRLW